MIASIVIATYAWLFVWLISLWNPTLSAECISLTPQGPICLPSITLECSFCNLHFVIFEEFLADGFRFNPLTPNLLLRRPDYEEMFGDGLYTLRITDIERYNGTQYRCHGFDDTASKISSDPLTLIVPGECLHEYAAFVLHSFSSVWWPWMYVIVFLTTVADENACTSEVNTTTMNTNTTVVNRTADGKISAMLSFTCDTL